MKDTNMKTHYVYKTTNRTTGEYYYGKRSCDGHWRDDSYMGSGDLLKRKMSAHPDHDWHKEVLLLLDSEEEAYEYEEVVIGDKWRGAADGGDDLCLNQRGGGMGQTSESATDMWLNPEYRARYNATVGAPEHRARLSANTKALWEDEAYRARVLADRAQPEQRAKISAAIKAKYEDEEYRARRLAGLSAVMSTPEHKAKMSKAHRNTHVRMCIAGEEQQVAVDAVRDSLRHGATFVPKRILVHSDDLQISLHVSRGTAVKLILDHNFEYGKRGEYAQVGAKYLKEIGVL